MTTPDPCARCGTVHTGCTAHTSKGAPCKRRPNIGMTTCNSHGGRSPQAIKKRDERAREDAARADAARFAARTDIHPAEALLELVHYQAGIVDYWRSRVEDVDAKDLEWGVTKHEDGFGPEGPIDKKTKEAAPHVAYRLLVEAQDKLAAYAAAALKAGVEQAKVDIAQRQGEAMAGVQRAILDRMLGATVELLREHGVTDDEILAALRSGWAEAIGLIVPEELRRLAPGSPS